MSGFPVEVRDFYPSPSALDRFWGPPHPPLQWVPGAVPPAVKRPGREFDHLPPTSVEVKNHVAKLPIPPTSSRCEA
jgi:hypothetical protein